MQDQALLFFVAVLVSTLVVAPVGWAFLSRSSGRFARAVRRGPRLLMAAAAFFWGLSVVAGLADAPAARFWMSCGAMIFCIGAVLFWPFHPDGEEKARGQAS